MCVPEILPLYFLQVEGLTIFFVGDVVTVMDDIVLVHELQKDGPGWVDDMALVNATTFMIMIFAVYCIINVDLVL